MIRVETESNFDRLRNKEKGIALSLNYWMRIRRVGRKFKRVIVLAAVFFVLFAASTLVKNIILGQIKQRIQSTFGYSRLYLSVFPPALIIEDVRSVSSSPFFSASRVSIQISTRSLVSREQAFSIIVQDPVFRVYETPGVAEGGGIPLASLAVPFLIERGLIRNGELHYWGRESRLHALGINAHFNSRNENFQLRAEVAEHTFEPGRGFPRLEGRFDLWLEGRGDNLEIRRMKLSGPDGIVKASGQLRSLSDPEFRLDMSYNLRTPPVARILELPFVWSGKVDGRGVLSREEGRINFEGSLASDSLVLSGESMGLASGNVRYREGAGGTVEIAMRRSGEEAERLTLQIKPNGDLEGRARGVHLDALANFLELPWPVNSPVWGTFSVVGERLSADAEFRDETVLTRTDRFPFRGHVRLDWDGMERVTFSSEDLESSFARIKGNGRLTVEKDLEIHLEGDVLEGRQTRRFVELILLKDFTFPEIRGVGRASIDLFGDFFQPQLKGTLSMSPAGFDRLDAESVTGEIELIKEDFFGRFEVEDPLFKGRIGLFAREDQARTNIWVDRGRVETLLPALEVYLPLEGEGSGSFEYIENPETIQYSGTFQADQLEFLGQPVKNVRGKIQGDLETVDFPDLRFEYQGGDVGGRLFLKPLSLDFDVDVRGTGIDLSLFSPESFKGNLNFEAKGKGALGRDEITGSYQIEELLVQPFQNTRSEGKMRADYTDETLNLTLEGGFFPGDNHYSVSLAIPFDDRRLSGEVNGTFTNMDLLFPWPGVQADITFLGELGGTRAEPRLTGAIECQGTLLPFPRFAHALRDFYGLVFLDNGDLSVRAMRGTFAGGSVTGAGSLRIGRSGVENIDLEAEGENLALAPLERTRALAGGKVTLFKDAERFVLGGELIVDQLLWQREIDEKFTFSSSAYPLSRREPNFFDDMTLDVRLRAEDNARMDNSLGQLRGRFDLGLTGNIFNPVVMGEIETLDGTVEFQDRSFRILEGRVSFFNPAVIEPYLHFKGETFVKDYRVTFSLDGLPTRLNPEFSSSPPLPPEDVLALLSLGMAFRRTYQYDRSIGQSTASLLSFTLSEEAKKRAEKIFSIDRFRIDPFIMGSTTEMTARLTLGKKLSRNFFIGYSTNLSTQREDITRLEWELTRDLSIVGTRDETGRISIDVKVHKRF